MSAYSDLEARFISGNITQDEFDAALKTLRGVSAMPVDDRPNNYRCRYCGEDGHETDTCEEAAWEESMTAAEDYHELRRVEQEGANSYWTQRSTAFANPYPRAER